jgi:hypothetical protein
MKKIGLIVLIIGLAITLFTGFKYITREKVVDIGDIQISRDKTNTVSWSPLIGVGVMVVGAGIFLFGQKSKS